MTSFDVVNLFSQKQKNSELFKKAAKNGDDLGIDNDVLFQTLGAQNNKKVIVAWGNPDNAMNIPAVKQRMEHVAGLLSDKKFDLYAIRIRNKNGNIAPFTGKNSFPNHPMPLRKWGNTYEGLTKVTWNSQKRAFDAEKDLVLGQLPGIRKCFSCTIQK